jgi:hypothetical protein
VKVERVLVETLGLGKRQLTSAPVAAAAAGVRANHTTAMPSLATRFLAFGGRSQIGESNLLSAKWHHQLGLWQRSLNAAKNFQRTVQTRSIKRDNTNVRWQPSAQIRRLSDKKGPAHESKSGSTRGERAKEKGKETLSKFKYMFKKYGPLFVGFYGGLYISTLGLMYVCVEYNVFSKGMKEWILDLQDYYADMLKKVGLDGLSNHGKIDSKAGSFAVAWIAAKLTEPFRFAISVYTVPKLARFLKYK